MHDADVPLAADARRPRASSRVDGAQRHDGPRRRCRQSARRVPGLVAATRRRLFIGSHLDTVPHAGAFDGVLGVVLGVALVDLLERRPLPFAIEVVGFSEEEGVRFGVPFIGSRALVGSVDDELLARPDAHGRSVADAIRDYGLDPSSIARRPRRRATRSAISSSTSSRARCSTASDCPLGVVDAIVGQSRLPMTFTGTRQSRRHDADERAPRCAGRRGRMDRRRRERSRSETPGLVATVGRIDAAPGAAQRHRRAAAQLSLDVRHADDAARATAVAALLDGRTTDRGAARARRRSGHASRSAVRAR